jgi:hypothetical protein
MRQAHGKLTDSLLWGGCWARRRISLQIVDKKGNRVLGSGVTGGLGGLAAFARKGRKDAEPDLQTARIGGDTAVTGPRTSINPFASLLKLSVMNSCD